jgi:hypothetical protein
MTLETFMAFIAGFAVLLTLIYMIKTDARSKRKAIYERIEKLEAAFTQYKEDQALSLINYLIK